MRTCKEVSKLVSESLDHELSLWQRLGLWIHLSMCKFCRRYRKDLLHIHSEIQQRALAIEEDITNSEEKLSDNSRERIKSLLESQQ